MFGSIYISYWSVNFVSLIHGRNNKENVASDRHNSNQNFTRGGQEIFIFASLIPFFFFFFFFFFEKRSE